MTAEIAPSGLSVRPLALSDDDLRAFGACFARNGSPRSFEALDWQYRRNPTGRVFVDVAVADDRFAAIYATLPVFARVDGEVRLALQSLDTLTDADFRGKGLFVRLAKETFARAARDGAAFVYGFPNGNSAHGFFKKLEWTSLDPLPFLIRPLRTGYAARMALGEARARWIPDLPLVPPALGGPGRGLTARHVERFDERFTDLWRAFFAMGARVAVERDARYLTWRLVEKPGEDYRSVAAFDGDRPVAFVSHCVKDKHGGRVGYVMEVMFARGHARAARALLHRALVAMRDARADVALAWCFPHSPSFTTYLACGFVPFPERFRPVELHVGARSLAAATPTVRDRRAWYISYLDSDTV
jgi:GNAT superfamily N-acetyltransferase